MLGGVNRPNLSPPLRWPANRFPEGRREPSQADSGPTRVSEPSEDLGKWGGAEGFQVSEGRGDEHLGAETNSAWFQVLDATFPDPLMHQEPDAPPLRKQTLVDTPPRGPKIF